MEASMAKEMVSRSRISPTKIMSGSSRNAPRSAAEKLRVWFDENKYCTGRIEDAINPERISMRALRLSFKFTACPPCFMRVRSKRSGWEPTLESAVPEQITAGTETVSGVFSAAGRLPVMEDQGVHSPALYFAVTGTWTQISIGGMTITQAYTTSHTVYLDCDAQVAYTMDAGIKTSVPVAGDFPLNDAAGIQVGGTALNATVRALLIERW